MFLYNETMNNISVREFIVFILVSNLVAISLFAAFTLLQEDSSVDDSSAADNNCCIGPDCSNYGGDFVAGFEACSRGECDKCASGSQSCDNDRFCDPGEQHLNCPSDCDEGGFSELGVGSACDPLARQDGRDQCQGSGGFKCVGCPEQYNNSGGGLCTDKFASFTDSTTTPNQAFIDEFCEPAGIGGGQPIGDIGACLPLDSDVDSRLTITDLSNFAQNFEASCTTSSEVEMSSCGSQDINVDGQINITDLTRFALFFDQNCTNISGAGGG